MNADKKHPKGFIGVYLCPSAAKSGHGAVAQLGERLICIQEVAGSIPTSSTSLSSMGELLPSLVGPVAQLVRAHP